MLETLRRVVQEVSKAPDLEHALEIIVDRVKSALDVEVCSVYLADEARGEYVLRATEGLAKASVGQVKLPFGQGLVGLIAQRAETINLAEGRSHRGFHLVRETGEEPFHGYLGAPIIRHRKVLGVLVAQRERIEAFSDEEVSFLVTLAAQLAGAITHADIMEAFGLAEQGLGRHRVFDGLPGAPGVAAGQAVVVYAPASLDGVPNRKAEDPAKEEKEFLVAVTALRREIRRMGARMAKVLPAEEQAVFDAYAAMLSGDTLVTETCERIRAGQWAPRALRDTVEGHARVFDEMEDPYLAERGRDLRELGRRILMKLQAVHPERTSYKPGTVLVGEEVSAMQLAEVPRDCLEGVVALHGSGYSHVAILARALGIPAVMGCADLPIGRIAHLEIIADGYSGKVHISPSETVRAEYARLRSEEAELTRYLEKLRDRPSETRDGVRVPLYANSGLLADVTPAARSMAEGIGLYRTEFPFLIRDRFPGEKEQTRIYREALKAFAPNPVVLRTLDAGGDKALPYFPINEENPFLGWRGIRLTLDHPEIFLTQFRAMLRADIDLGNLQILLPMISSVHELEDALNYLQQALDELTEEGLAVRRPKLGVMIEVPSAVYQIDAMARRVDFFSVGTNDLTQYLLAVDRNNERVAELYDHLHPAVVRALGDIFHRAHAENRPVGVCGEMADDPAAVLLLMGMGVDSLSMSTGSISRIKWVVRSFTKRRADELLERALEFEDALEIRQMLTDALVEHNLGGLVRAGKQ